MHVHCKAVVARGSGASHSQRLRPVFNTSLRRPECCSSSALLLLLLLRQPLIIPLLSLLSPPHPPPPPLSPNLSPLPSPPQAALLSSFPAIFEELLQVFSVQEVCELVRGALGCMPSTLHMGHSMDVVRLQSIARTVDSPLFSFPGQRSPACAHTDTHTGSNDCVIKGVGQNFGSRT